MKEKKEKILIRSGHRNYINSQRIMLYHLANLKQIQNCKNFSSVSSVVDGALKLDKYYVLKVTTNDNKYVHLEKDSSVILTEYPTCFFETEIFDDEYYFKTVGEFILSMIKKTNLKIELEIISNSKMNEILDKRV